MSEQERKLEELTFFYKQSLNQSSVEVVPFPPDLRGSFGLYALITNPVEGGDAWVKSHPGNLPVRAYGLISVNQWQASILSSDAPFNGLETSGLQICTGVGLKLDDRRTKDTAILLAHVPGDVELYLHNLFRLINAEGYDLTDAAFSTTPDQYEKILPFSRANAHPRNRIPLHVRGNKAQGAMLVNPAGFAYLDKPVNSQGYYPVSINPWQLTLLTF